MGKLIFHSFKWSFTCLCLTNSRSFSFHLLTYSICSVVLSSPFLLHCDVSCSINSYISSSDPAGVDRLSRQLKGFVAGWKPVDGNTCSKITVQLISVFFRICFCLLFLLVILSERWQNLKKLCSSPQL